MVFDRFPAAVDITYYGNMLAAGANARAIRGYEFASDRYLAGRDLSARMLEIASEVTAQAGRRVEGPGPHRWPAGHRGRGEVREVGDTTAGYREISTLKMTVEMDGGQRVYGTVPAAILDALTGGVISGGDAPRDEQLKGRRVEFTATVEVSDNDPAFGFYLAAVEGVAGRVVAA